MSLETYLYSFKILVIITVREGKLITRIIISSAFVSYIFKYLVIALVMQNML